MRTTTILVAFLLGLFTAQAGEISLLINHSMQGQALRSGATYSMDDGSWFFKPRFLKYYLAELTVIHDGGKRTPLSDVYVLVDALGQDRYVLGSLDVTRIEALEFHVGVDKKRNHLDPTLYPPEHPLALKNPTMHWGWAAGYRFLAVEGSSGTTRDVISTDVQVHTVGNELYRKVTLPVATRETATGVDIILAADYSALFRNLDVSFGLIFHGYGEETVVMSDNMATRVFTSPTTGVAEYAESQELLVWPTPTSGQLTLAAQNMQLTHAQLIDACGTALPLHLPNDHRTSWDLSSVAAGTYTLVVTTASGTTHHAPVVILR